MLTPSGFECLKKIAFVCETFASLAMLSSNAIYANTLACTIVSDSSSLAQRALSADVAGCAVSTISDEHMYLVVIDIYFRQ